MNDHLHAASREAAPVAVSAFRKVASFAKRAIALALVAGLGFGPAVASAHEAAFYGMESVHQGLQGVYTVEARGPDGALIRRETFHNLVTTQGKNAMLDKFLGLGAPYALIYFGLITSNTAPVAGDTYASHGFTEAGTSIVSARIAPTYGAASGGSKATSAGTTFTLNAAATIYGLMQVLGPTGVATAGDTSTSGAVLYSAGQFASSISVPSGSTITVSYTGSL